MKAPNKINLPYKDGHLFGLVKDDGLPFRDCDGNIEYVRKDALLTMLEERKTQHKQWLDKYGEVEDDAIVGFIDYIIDKINAL